MISGGLQEFAGKSANGFFVLREKDCFPMAATGGKGLSCEMICLQLLLRLRQINFETGSGAEGGFQVNVTGTLIDDAVDSSEAQASAFARIFRSEERLKDTSLDFRAHSATGVGDGKHDVVPRFNGGMRAGIPRVHGNVMGFDEQAAALRHGVGRVYREV